MASGLFEIAAERNDFARILTPILCTIKFLSFNISLNILLNPYSATDRYYLEQSHKANTFQTFESIS